MSNNVFSNTESIILDNHNYLKRDHIYNLLEESIQKPTTVVVAGAGYGKTQAVYSFLQEYNATTIWQQLSALDNISARFWANFVNVISLIDKKLASDMEMLGFPDTAIKFDIFLSYILEVIKSDKKYVTVYDDFHFLHEKKILRFMEKLVNANIPNHSIILISRSEPEINTAGLFAKGLLSMISENHLRFSKSDLVCYYEMQNIQLSRQTISKIYKNTDGWIMAIRLLELSIRKGGSHEEYALTAMELTIFKLIESEVFLAVSEEVQIFLVKLSLFSSLPLKLIEALFPNHEQLINAMSKINSFIHYDSFSNSYCIHHLFLDFLKQKQVLLTQSEKAECYQKAADWYALNNYKIDAITCYEKTGDYGGILKNALIFPHASPEEAVLILEIMNRAPEEAYKQEPLLAVLHFRALNLVGRMKEASAILDMLIKKYEALPRGQEIRLILSEIYIAKGLNAYYASVNTNDSSFSDYFKKAYSCVPEGGTVLKVKYSMQEVGAYACRISSDKKEDMEKYVENVKIAAYYASKVMRGCMCGLDDLAQAELAYFKNSIKMAGKFAYQALYKAREKQQYIIEIRALFYLLRIYVSTGDYIKIQELLKQLEAEKFYNSQTLYDIVTGWLYSVVGQGNKVADWIKSDFEQGNLNIFASGAENLAKIKYCLSEGKYYELLAFLESQESEYSIGCFLFGKIANEAIKAVCLYRIKEKDEAIIALQKAYHLAEPNSLTMQFVELGNDMVSLAKFALKSAGCTIPHDWLKNILIKSSTYAKRVSHVTSEYERTNGSKADFQSKLTKRELEFLNDICQGMSRAEIALNYDISPNYVKNRLQIIYAKLGAKNPIDAIRIATLMKLIK